MGDFFTNNLWEEEPDFAKDDTNEQGENSDGQQYDENENNHNYGAQHVIALVDCHPDMFQVAGARSSSSNNDKIPAAPSLSPPPIDLSIKLIQTLLQQTIEQTVIKKTGKRNGVGLLLYNTKTERENSTRDRDGIKNGDDDEDEDDKMDDEDDEDDKMDDEDEEEEDDDVDDDDDDEFTTPPAETTVHRLLDLEPPGIKHVQTLRKLFSNDDDANHQKNHQHQKKAGGRDLRAEFCPSARDSEPIVAPLQTALEEATRMFLNAKCVRDPNKNAKNRNEYDSKSIWVFTNQANPYSDEKKELIGNIANLAKEQRIEIIVWPLELCRSNSNSNSNNAVDEDGGEDTTTFDSPFFESVATTIFASDHGQRLRSESDMQELLEDIVRTMTQKRRTYYGPMHILRPGKGMPKKKLVSQQKKDRVSTTSIMIDWYSVVQLTRRPGKVQIDTQTKRETVKVRLSLEKDTGKDVARFWTKPTPEQREHQRNQPGMHRFRQFFNFANELVPITQQDMRSMKKNANGGYAPGLTILGFKPRDAIPFYHSVSKTFLIFPNDTDVQGSRNAFEHLHAAMLRKNVLGVGEVLHTRETSQSRLVAIHPFEATDYLPPGMYVTTLPFEDDMRAVAPDAASIEMMHLRQQQQQQQNEQQTRGKTVLPDQHNEPDPVVSTEIRFGLSPDGDTNRQPHDHALGSVASEALVAAAMNLMSRQSLSSMEIGSDFENAALIDFYSYLTSVAFDTIQEERIYDTRENESVLKIARKEIDAFQWCLPVDVEPPKTTTTSRKRVRTIVPDDSGMDWNELYRTDEIGTCTMDVLKKHLRSVGLPTSGRKSDLVARVTESVEEKWMNDKMRYTTKEQGSIKAEEELVVGII